MKTAPLIKILLRNWGGGINNIGSLTISGSTFSRNQGAAGGGVTNNSGTIEIANSTFSGNEATTTGFGGGGALMNWWTSTITLTHTTIYGNSAPAGGADGISIPHADAVVNLQNSILYNNGDDLTGVGTATSQGYNIIGISTVATFTPDSTDLIGTDPQLQALADNVGTNPNPRSPIWQPCPERHPCQHKRLRRPVFRGSTCCIKTPARCLRHWCLRSTRLIPNHYQTSHTLADGTDFNFVTSNIPSSGGLLEYHCYSQAMELWF